MVVPAVWWSTYEKRSGSLVCQVRAAALRPNRLLAFGAARDPPPAPATSGNLDEGLSGRSRHPLITCGARLSTASGLRALPSLGSSLANPLLHWRRPAVFFPQTAQGSCRFKVARVIVHRPAGQLINPADPTARFLPSVTHPAARKVPKQNPG